jgi:hypothetical protein
MRDMTNPYTRNRTFLRNIEKDAKKWKKKQHVYGLFGSHSSVMTSIHPKLIHRVDEIPIKSLLSVCICLS